MDSRNWKGNWASRLRRYTGRKAIEAIEAIEALEAIKLFTTFTIYSILRI